MKSAKDVPFGGFDPKIFIHPILAPKLPNFVLRKLFSLQTRINLGGKATEFCSQIENSPSEIQILV